MKRLTNVLEERTAFTQHSRNFSPHPFLYNPSPHGCPAMLKPLLLAASLLLTTAFTASPRPAAPSSQLAKLHYGGGGDWYANKTSLPNLIAFCNQTLHTNLAPAARSSATSASGFSTR